MKMFYIKSIRWEKPAVLCQEFSVERYGYDGADLESELELRTAEDVEQYGFNNAGVVLLSEDQVSKVKEFISTTNEHDEKYKNLEVAGSSIHKWRTAFKHAENPEFVAVEFKL